MKKGILLAVALMAMLTLLPADTSAEGMLQSAEGHADGLDVVYLPDGDGMGTLYITMEDPPTQEVSVFVYSLSSGDTQKVEYLLPAQRFNVTVPALLDEVYHLMIVDARTSATVAECDLMSKGFVIVRFDPGEGSGAMSPVTLEAGSSYTLPLPALEAPKGMMFEAWTMEGGDGKMLQPGEIIFPNGTVTLRAMWVKAPSDNQDSGVTLMIGILILIILVILILVYLYRRRKIQSRS